MNQNLTALILHAVVGLAVVAAVSVLAALSVVTGTQALDLIYFVAGVLLGTGSATIGNLPNGPKPPA